MGKSSSTAGRCWFTQLSIEQVVALAAAVGLTGCDLVTRLHAHPLTAPYGLTYKAPPVGVSFSEAYPGGYDGGVSHPILQELCRERSLPAGPRRSGCCVSSEAGRSAAQSATAALWSRAAPLSGAAGAGARQGRR